MVFCNHYPQNLTLYNASAIGDLVKVKELVDKGADATWHRPDWVSSDTIHVMKFSPGMLKGRVMFEIITMSCNLWLIMGVVTGNTLGLCVYGQ